jgi:16S rRNA (guanine(966)-N(2))-methyltransferase RsmD
VTGPRARRVRPGEASANDRPSTRRLVPHQVRIVGGQWKRTPLVVADKPGLRPTPQRLRETLFNWLGQNLAGWRVLDAFAGSGALGFEAASRGAAEVVMLERDAELVQQLQAVKHRLRAATVQVHRANTLVWMSRCAPQRFDLVLLDPPFEADLTDQAVSLAVPLVGEAGWIYVESPGERTAAPAGFERVRHAQAGAVHAQLLRRTP